MNCENAKSQILDLLGGDLRAEDAVLVRAHIDGCEACLRDHAQLAAALRLARGMPVEAPPSRVRETVMARARLASAGVQAGRSTASEEAREPALSRFVRWISGFVLGPQVAMAMVLLLMVGVGLFYLPGLRRDRAVQGGAIVNADPGDEAGPSATMEPAEPLDLRLDTRTNRLQPAAGAAEQVIAARPTTAVAIPSDEVAAEDIQSGAPSSATLVPGEVTEPEPIEQVHAIPLEGPSTRSRLAARAATPEEEPSTEEERVAPALDERAAEEDVALQATGRAAEPYAAAAPGRGSGGASADAEPVASRRERSLETSAAPPPARSALSAMGGARASAVGSMAAVPAPAAPSFAPSPPAGGDRLRMAAAQHATARTQAQTGQVRAAIASYETLIRSHPTYERAPEAMLELAELHRRLGDLSSARVWLARAERSPAYAGRARSARTRLDDLERAPAAAAAGPASE